LGLAKKSLGTFISRSAIFLFRFPIGIIIARFLGAEGKGVLYLLIVSISITVMATNLGLGPASIYFIGKDRKRLPAIVGNLLAVTGVLTVILAATGWLLLQYGRPEIYFQLPLWMWGIAVLLVPIQLLRSLLLQALSAVLRIKEINLVDVASIIIHLLLVVLFVIAFDGGIGGAFLAFALSEVLASTSFLLMVFRHGGWPTRPDLNLLGACLRFGVKPYASNLTRLLNRRVDAFLVVSLAAGGMTAIGIYSVASNLTELILFIPRSIRLTLFPMVAASSAAEANRLTSAACRHTMFLTMIGALILSALGPFVITYLYGEAFVGAVIPLLIMLPGTLMLSQADIFYHDLAGRGKPGVSTISALIGLVFAIVLNLALIPRYGIIGASVAFTCVSIVEFAVSGFFFIRHTSLAWRDVLVFRRSDLRHYPQAIVVNTQRY